MPFRQLVQKDITRLCLYFLEGRKHHNQGLSGSPLYVAAAKGYVHIVLQLLEYGANVDSTGKQYCNALFAAAADGHGGVMQMLLGYGASVYRNGSMDLDLSGYGTAVVATSPRGHANTLSMLLSLKSMINVTIESAKGWSPYAQAEKFHREQRQTGNQVSPDTPSMWDASKVHESPKNATVTPFYARGTTELSTPFDLALIAASE
ncbi:hypothetical protein BDW75DRAFT_245410 [Aspergillus navahoensis]